MVNAYKVAENIYLIDAQMYSFSEFTSVYLLAEEKMTLIESGPSTSAEFILDGIRQLGFDPKDMAHIIVTHVHLDHAGGAGVLLKEMPQAKIIAHERGTRHLVDPSRLVKSVEQTWGEEGMRRYGVISPIDRERVCSVKDGDVIELSKEQKLSIIYAPGHAHHQICIYESRNKGLFTGDAVGIYFSEGEILIPATPPPDFDLNISINTIKRLMALPTEMLLFSHFGVTKKVAETLELAVEELKRWGDVTWKAMKGGDFEDALDELKAQASKKMESVRERKALEYTITNFIPLCAAGYMNYYRKMGER
jgi:glyoxylase-like metal-dependent hydrolase (beta-lactamase superfamily II)